MNPQFCGFFVFRCVKLKIGDDKFPRKHQFQKVWKNLLTEEGRRKEGRKEGREGGREEGREAGDEPWPLAFFTPVERSTAHLPTLGQPKAKPSQAKTKPNQTRPGCCSCCCCCCWWYSTNKPNPRYLLTYCFALTNKQTNQKPSNQPTNQPLFHPPTQNKQNKTKGFVQGFKPQKQNTHPSLPPSLPRHLQSPKKKN